jgi:WD40 repeat protein/tetratricopeptide (TPR) repeat protein
MDALDFELEIGDPENQRYPVTARAPGGEAATSMHLAGTAEEFDRELSVISDAVLASSAVARRAIAGDERPVQQLGQRLFEALVTDDVRGLYVASAQRAREEGRVLRLVLRIRPPGLARLPWEFLFDPARQDYLGLSLPLVRYPQVLAPRQPLEAPPPLQILGMVARPGDQDALQVDDEQRRLRGALAGLERDGLVKLSWVAGQTYSDLEDAMDLGPWHIFHFVGHGGYDQRADEGTIALVTAQGRTDQVGADDLSRLLGDHHALRLVVLNACDTGRASTLDVFSSTAAALMRRGLPAVVAMQFPISDPAAIKFAETFYQGVAKRLPVDISVMRGRRALRRAKKDTLEWGTPVLYLRAPDGLVFASAEGEGHLASPAPPWHPHEQAASQQVEALYDDAIAAFWTEQFDRAIELLRQVIAIWPDHPTANVRLEEARRQHQLAIRYAQACGAAEAEDWDQAVDGFSMVSTADPSYRDVAARLKNAGEQQQLAGLRAEARRLHRASQWAAVIKIGERLQELNPDAADPFGLVTSARAELAAAEQAERLAEDYRAALGMLDDGAWQQAADALERIAEADPGYRDTPALLARARSLARGPGQVHEPRQPQPELDTPAPPTQARGQSTETEQPPPEAGGIIEQPRVVFSARHTNGPIDAVAFSADGHWLATSGDGAVWIWDVTTRERPLRSTPPAGAITFSADSSWFLAYDARMAQIRDTATGRPSGRVIQHNSGNPHAVALTLDGRWLATPGHTNRICIWNTADGREQVTIPYGKATGVFAPVWKVEALAFSPDGRWLAAAIANDSFYTWDAATGRALVKVAHSKAVSAVAFSPDGRWLAIASRDKTARIWDAATGRALIEVAHSKAVSAVAFSPDGRWLATASSDKTARIWDAATGKMLTELAHDMPVFGVRFNSHGDRLATACKSSAQIWALRKGSDR